MTQVSVSTADEVGDAAIRQQFFEKTVKGRADREYKFKQAVTISPTSAWKNFFYRESTTVLTGASGNATRGIPRGAAFPQAVVTWDKIQTNIEKYGLEDTIHWEDILTSDLDVQARTLFRIAEGVAKAVDDEIWDELSESQSASNIHSVTATVPWETSATATPLDDIEAGKQLIAENNYDIGNLLLFVNPRGRRDLLAYLSAKGAQFPSIGTEAARNGRTGMVAGTTVVVSNSVTASYALLCVPKVCGTWKQLVPLQTTTIEDKYKSLVVRSVEMGVTQLTDPKAVCLINTK